MPGVQRRVIIIGKRRVRGRSQAHEMIVEEPGQGVSVAVTTGKGGFSVTLVSGRKQALPGQTVAR